MWIKSTETKISESNQHVKKNFFKDRMWHKGKLFSVFINSYMRERKTHIEKNDKDRKNLRFKKCKKCNKRLLNALNLLSYIWYCSTCITMCPTDILICEIILWLFFIKVLFIRRFCWNSIKVEVTNCWFKLSIFWTILEKKTYLIRWPCNLVDNNLSG